MAFGIVGRTGPGIRQVAGFGHPSTGKGTFWDEFGAPHCNQWGLYGVRVRQRRDEALFPNYFGQTCSEMSLHADGKVTRWTQMEFVNIYHFKFILC